MWARRLGVAAAVAAFGLALAAARQPAALAGSSPGLWEVTAAGNRPAARLCVADLGQLAQFEHRGKSCTRVLIENEPTTAVIHYTCQGSDFGRTKITAITPRSLRIETQGIAANAPFSVVLQARRVGSC